MDEEQHEINVAVMNDCMDKIYDFLVHIEKDFDLEVCITSMHYFIVSQLRKNGIPLDEFIKTTVRMWITHELDK